MPLSTFPLRAFCCCCFLFGSVWSLSSCSTSSCCVCLQDEENEKDTEQDTTQGLCFICARYTTKVSEQNHPVATFNSRDPGEGLVLFTCRYDINKNQVPVFGQGQRRKARRSVLQQPRRMGEQALQSLCSMRLFLTGFTLFGSVHNPHTT